MLLTKRRTPCKAEATNRRNGRKRGRREDVETICMGIAMVSDLDWAMGAKDQLVYRVSRRRVGGFGGVLPGSKMAA